MAPFLRCRDCDEWRPGWDPDGNKIPPHRGTCVHRIADVRTWSKGRKRPDTPLIVTTAKRACVWRRKAVEE